MKKIYEILGITQEAYNSLLFDKFFDWCGYKAHDQVDMQKLVANKRMYKFFMVQITGLEIDFREEAIPYLELNDSHAMTTLWDRHMNTVFMYYNQRILELARNAQSFNNIRQHDIRNN